MNNLQTIFDKVAKHLLKQNEKSLILRKDFEPLCAYRNPEGLKCAAGCLISDKDYKKVNEGTTWDETSWSTRYTSDENDLIVRLQKIHDLHEPEEWKSQLMALADSKTFELGPEFK